MEFGCSGSGRHRSLSNAFSIFSDGDNCKKAKIEARLGRGGVLFASLFRLPDRRQEGVCDQPSQVWRCRISDLLVLFGSWPAKQVVGRKCLQAGGLTYGKAAALRRIVMDIVASVLGDVAGDGGGGSIRGRRKGS